MVFTLAALGLLVAACGTSSSVAARVAAPTRHATMMEYVAGGWVPFSAAPHLTTTQCAVVNAYANFSTAAFAVYTAHSVALLATVASPQSKVTAMFSRDLASGVKPEAPYVKATV